MSALASIGGGLLSVPLLLMFGLAMRYAVDTSAAIGLCIAVLGTLSAMLLGSDDANLPEYTLSYVIWPAALAILTVSTLTAPLSARLTQRLHTAWLKRLFAVILLVTGLRMLWSVG